MSGSNGRGAARPVCGSLSARGLVKAFGGQRVLSALDLDVPAGSLTAVLGPSGCGKTTLLRLIAGFEHADGGTITLDGVRLIDDRLHVAPERRRIGVVAQDGALFPHLDVAANIAFGLGRAARRTGRVDELLALVGLAGLGRRRPHELSGGQQQRVALARALAPAPDVVLLDEPFTALDPGLRASLRTDVRAALAAAGTTALLVTHDQTEALSLADQVAVMRGGRIVQAADPRTLYRDPVDSAVALFVGEAVLLPARLANGRVESALGTLPARALGRLPDGPVTLMLRPEQIECRLLLEEASPGAARGRVLASTFFGHDAILHVALDRPGGEQIIARAAGHRLPDVGDEVALLVEGSALAYPDGAPPQTAHPESNGQAAGRRGADPHPPAAGSRAWGS